VKGAIDAALLHRIRVSQVERDAIERLVDALLAAFTRALPRHRLPRADQLQRAAAAAAAAGLAELERALVTIIRASWAAAARTLRAAGARHVREQQDTGDIFRPMGARRARELAQKVLSSPRGGMKAFDLTQTVRRAAGDALAAGLAAGEKPDSVIDRMRDALGEKRKYEAFALTAIHDAASRAADELYEANRDVIDGVTYTASLDDRSCVFCASYDGQTYWMAPDAGEQSYASRPPVPLHPRCRCTYIPVVKPLARALPKAAAEKLPPPERERPELLDRISYSRWLAAQPEDVQREILGPGRFAAWRAGIPLRGFRADGRLRSVRDLLRSASAEATAVRPITPQPLTGIGAHAAAAQRSAGLLITDAAARITPLAGETAGVEVIGAARAAELMRSALHALPPDVRRALRVETRGLRRYVRGAGTDMESAAVTGLTAAQAQAVASHLASLTREAEVRVRGGRLGWKRRWLTIRRTRSGYVEYHSVGAVPGAGEVEVRPARR